MSSHEQKPQLEPQANRLWAHAGQNGIKLDRVVSEVASGLNDRRPKLRRLLADPKVGYILVERRDRLARFGVGMVDAMLQARGGGLLVIEDHEVHNEVDADLVRDMNRDADVLLRPALWSAQRCQSCPTGDQLRYGINGMVRKRNSQRSSCPEAWLKDGIKLPVRLTVRQGQYAARGVGIARSVCNLMVATHRSARAQVHGLWPSPMELEQIFNELKHEPEFGMEYATEVSKFVAQGACRDFRRADENWRNPTLNAERPTFKKKEPYRHGLFPGRLRRGPGQV